MPIFVFVAVALLIPSPVLATSATGLDLVSIWSQGDSVARATLLCLGAMSVVTWATAAIKAIELTGLSTELGRAEAIPNRPEPVDSQVAALPAAGPCRRLVETALDALRQHQTGQAGDIDRQTWLGLTLQQALARAPVAGGGGLTVLATIASTAPFVGLFGTVWSIHKALIGIGLDGRASIERVAGPVGESLVMTALGLAVAVPAVLAHNALARGHRRAGDRLRALAGDLLTRMLRDAARAGR